jgi:hypothetical protein
MIGRKEAQKSDCGCCSQGAYRRAEVVTGMKEHFLRLFVANRFDLPC